MPTRLSPRQLAVLRALAEPGARARYFRSVFNIPAYWKLNETRVTQQMRRLLDDGLVDTECDERGYCTFATINDAGRAELSPSLRP